MYLRYPKSFQFSKHLFTLGNGEGIIWLPVAITSRSVKETKIFSLREGGGQGIRINITWQLLTPAVSAAESVFKCKFLLRSWKPSNSQNAYRGHDLGVLKVLPCSEKTWFSELLVGVRVFFFEFESQTTTIFTHIFHRYNVWSAVSQWVCCKW